MKKIDFSKYIFKYKKLIYLFFILLCGYGIFSYFVIPKQDMPEFSVPYTSVVITSYGSSASDIDKYIVSDLYDLSKDTNDILEVNAISYDNYAVINYEFSYNIKNLEMAKDDIYNNILNHSFTINVNDITLYKDFYEPLAIYAISGDTTDNMIITAGDMANDFEGIDGVNKTIITSNQSYETFVDIDQDILDIYGLDFEYIYYKISSNLSDITLGYITNADNRFIIESNNLITNIESLENIIIISNYDGLGTNLLLKDVSSINNVNISNKIYEVNGNEAIFISLIGDDKIDVTKLDDELKDILTQYEDDVDIDVMVYMIDDVNRQLNSIFINLLITLGIVLLVMVVGINLKISLINLFCTVVIVFGTIGVLNFLGYSLEKLSIVGIIVSIGILVDNMVVIGEGISSNLDLDMDIEEAVKTSIRKNSIPVLSSSLTTIAAFFSITLLGGFLGEIIRSMPITVIIMITLSYIVSMTLLPLLSVLLFKKKKVKLKKVNKKQSVFFKKVLRLGMSYPVILLIVSLMSLGLFTFLVYNNQPIDLYPIDEKKAIYIDIKNDEDSTLLETYNLYKDAALILDDDPEVISYFSSTGGNLPRFHFSSLPIDESLSSGRLYLTLDLAVKDIPKYLKSLQLELNAISDKYTANFIELSPPENDLSVLLTSNSLTTLKSESDNIIDDILELDHITYSNVLDNKLTPKYEITYNTSVMNQRFITKEDIDQVIALYANGFNVETLRDEPDIYIYSSDYDVTFIEQLNITSSITNLDVPLNSLVSFNEILDYSVIRSVGGIYAVTVLIDVDDNYDSVSLKDDIKIISEDTNYSDIDFTYSGVNKMFEDILGSLITASIISLILIYLFMFIQFNSLIKPIIIYITIPLSFAGSLMFMILFDSPITSTSLIGIISLIGITVNTGILLVEYIDIEIKEHHKEVKDACVEAVYKRFKAILLTSLTTVLGLIPLLVNGGDFFSPLAITFMGGIFTSALLTIFLVPGIYHKIYKKRRT